MAEAVLWLVLARTMIAAVPMRWWRASLGRVDTAPAPVARSIRPAPPVCRVAVAVDRAARRLPLNTACLPRAMAVQWMLRRRRIGSTLVVGLASGGAPARYDLHAWVEADGITVIGADQRRYARGLALTHR